MKEEMKMMKKKEKRKRKRKRRLTCKMVPKKSMESTQASREIF